MDTYKTQSKTKVIMLLVFAMLFQIVGPVTFSVYAETVRSEDGLRAEVDGTTLNWVLGSDLNLNSGERVFKFKGDFELDGGLKGAITTNEEEILGGYTISEDGLVEFTLGEDFLASLKGKETRETREEVKNEAVEEVEEVEVTQVEDLSQGEGLDEQGKETAEGLESDTLADMTRDEAIEEPMAEENGEEVDKVRINFAGKIELGDSLIVRDIEKASPRALSGLVGEDLGPIFTFASLKLGEVDIEEDSPIKLDKDAKIKLTYNWDIKEKTIKSGDYSSIKLPEIFNVAGNFNAQDIEVVYNDEKVSIGKWNVIDGELTFIFNDELEKINPSDISNTSIFLEFKLNWEEISKNVSQEIKFNDLSGKTFKLLVKPGEEEIASISKIGVPDVEADSGVYKDAKAITWKVDVLNSGDGPKSNVRVFEEKLPEGLELDSASVKLTKLSIGYDGKTEELGASDSIEVNKIGESGFEYTISGIEAYSGYRLEYKTNIIDKTKEEFTNTVKTNITGEDLEAIATVGKISRSDVLSKTGKVDNYGDSIKWTIKINESGINIKNAILKDEIPEGLDLLKIEIKKNGEKLDTFTNVSKEDLGKGLELGPISETDKYTIEYETKLDRSKINGGNYEEISKFVNKATLLDGDKPIQDPVVVEVKVENYILEKSGARKAYSNEIEWTVHVNRHGYKIDGAYIEDTLPDGLSLIKNSVKIGLENIKDEDITIDGKKYKLNLGDIDGPVTIKYRTTIKDSYLKEDSFTNKVCLYTGVGNLIKCTKSPTDVINNAYYKSGGDINYEDKTITWTITIDPKKDPIKELKLTDTFVNGGMIFIKDSLKLVEGSLENKDLNKLVKPLEDNFNKGFILDLGEIEINEKILISYETSFDPDKGISQVEPKDGNKLKNKVCFDGETKSASKIAVCKEAYATLNSEYWNSGKKEGRLVHKVGSEFKDGWISGSDRYVEWKVYFNYLSQDLGSGVRITDTLGYEGSIDMDSIEVKHYSVGKKGNIEIKEELSKDKFSTGTTSGKNLNIVFNDSISDSYVVIYRTSVPEKSQAKYINQAKVITKNKEFPYEASVSYGNHNKFIDKLSNKLVNPVYTDDEIDWTIKINESLSTNISNMKINDKMSEGLVYKEDSFEVYRYIGDNKVLLEESKDYKFTSPNKDEEGILKLEFIGNISEFHEIKYKTIVVATTGSIKNTASIDGSYITDNKTSEKTYTVERFGGTSGDLFNRGTILINKVDSNDEGKVLEGAKFRIYYLLNGEERNIGEENYITDSEGKIEVKGLVLNRKYYVEEIEAPKGYSIINNEPIEVEFKDSKQVELKIVNSEKTQVTGKKVWLGGGPAAKPTIELQLYRELEGLSREAVREPIKRSNGQEEYTWDDLPKYDENNVVYKYTVDELEVPANYRKTISEDGLTVSNTFVPPGKPITPVDPDPVDPIRPRPVDPVDPKKPDPDPKKPEIITPVDPDPVKPIEPTEPGTTDPVEPIDPTEPEEPVEVPEVPTETIVLEPPAKGKVTVDKDGNWIYTPNPGQRGKDRFKIRKPDGTEEVFEIDLDEIPEGTINIKNGKPALGKKKLPKTGNTSNILFYSLGILFIGAGLSIKKKKQA